MSRVVWSRSLPAKVTLILSTNVNGKLFRSALFMADEHKRDQGLESLRFSFSGILLSNK